MNENYKIYFAGDLTREEVSQKLEIIREKNRKLHDFIVENLRKDAAVGIREDILDYLSEHIDEFRTTQDQEQEYAFNIASLICNMDISAEYLEWVNEYFKLDGRIAFDDFMVVLGEAIEKKIPFPVIKEYFTDAEDSLAIYSKVVEYTAPEEESIIAMEEPEEPARDQLVEPEFARTSVQENNIDVPGVFSNLLTIVQFRNKESNSTLENQEIINKIMAEFQLSLSKLSTFSTDMVREWEKDKEEIQKLTACNELLQKFLASNQNTINKLKTENKMLLQQLQNYERNEMQQETIRQKVAELGKLTSESPCSTRSALSSFQEKN